MEAIHTTKAFVGGQAPHFEASAYHKKTFSDISLSNYKGKYVVLFFWPLDFTFVCPTEIQAFSEEIKRFEEFNCQVIGCSVDSVFSHMEWSKKETKKGGLGELDFPMIGDVSKKICFDYGVLVKAGPN